jgi:hypothetical protein
VHELSREQPKTMKELLDITTRHASRKDVVGAIFVQDSGRAAPDSGWGAPIKATGKGTKKGTKSDKKGTKWRLQWVTVTSSYDEGDNDKDVDDSDKELVAAAKRDLKRQAR